MNGAAGTLTIHFRIANLEKLGKHWKINVYNPSETRATVYYNAKMCFERDAKNWRLNDVKTLSVGANSSAVVYIRRNFFATHIAVCGIDGEGRRAVTYADRLTAGGGIDAHYI